MDPLSLIGMGVGAVADLIGNLFRGGQIDEANKLRAQAAQVFGDVPQLGPTAFSEIKTDPRYADAQNHALDQLLSMEQGGGYTLADKAALNKIQNETAGRETANRAGILENMQARGVASSGATLASELAGEQGAANRASQAGTDTAAQAQARYFNAIMGRGQLGGQIRTQDYGEKSKEAAAKDLISRYNADQSWNKANAKAQGMYNQANSIAGEGDRTGQIIGGVGNAVGGFMEEQAQRNYLKDVYGNHTSDGLTAPPLVNAEEEQPWTNPYRTGGR